MVRYRAHANQEVENFLESKNQIFHNGVKRINNERMNMFIKGRDYPISVISNFLEIEGVIQLDLLKKIDKVRGFRNKIVHQDPDYICEPDHCVLSMEIAVELTLEGHPFFITLNKGYSRWMAY